MGDFCGLGKRSRSRRPLGEKVRTPTVPKPTEKPVVPADVPIDPPEGQRCRGRNYAPGRRCCTPEDPCDVGEGDCDGRGDGGFNDGDEGCKGDLVCGSNNCKQFGLYYHEKDDCCQQPGGTIVAEV